MLALHFWSLGAVKRTLKAGLDHIQWMNGERGDGAGGQAGNGLDQRGGEARMVFVHKGGRVAGVLIVMSFEGRGPMTALKLENKYFGGLPRHRLPKTGNILP